MPRISGDIFLRPQITSRRYHKSEGSLRLKEFNCFAGGLEEMFGLRGWGVIWELESQHMSYWKAVATVNSAQFLTMRRQKWSALSTSRKNMRHSGFETNQSIPSSSPYSFETRHPGKNAIIARASGVAVAMTISSLHLNQDCPTHCNTEPNAPMSLQEYRDALAETQWLWTHVKKGL